MKTKLIFTFVLLLFCKAFSQDITGTWFTALEIQGQKLPLVLHVLKSDGGYRSTFDSPEQGAKDIALEKTSLDNNNFSFSATNLNMNFDGKFSGDKIEGTFKQNGISFPMIFTRNENPNQINRPQTPHPPYNYDNEDVTIKNETEGNILAGTISSPKNFDKNKPILVMITGSGKQNRDEEFFGHKIFLVIADDFAKKGIATLRMDDRGVGDSEAGKANATSMDFAGDISSAVNFLVKKGYKNIGLIGHSEGGMIAPIVADKNKNVKFLVLLAGPGEPIEDLMIQQTAMQAKSSGASQEQIKENENSIKKLYQFMQNYKGNDLQNDLKKRMIEELKSTRGKEISSDVIEKIAESQMKTLTTPWFQYFIKFRPEDYLSKIKIPVLALNGSLDTQVSPKENLSAIQKSLTKAGNKNFETVELPGLNHLFQTAKTGAVSEYGQIEETISPMVLNKMTDWILSISK